VNSSTAQPTAIQKSLIIRTCVWMEENMVAFNTFLRVCFLLMPELVMFTHVWKRCNRQALFSVDHCQKMPSRVHYKRTERRIGLCREATWAPTPGPRPGRSLVYS